MKHYQDLYLKCNILQFEDVFEKFRCNSLKNYLLRRSHYLSASAQSQDAVLNMRKIKLELILDPDMHIFFEKDIRSEVSYISNRYKKADNNYLKSYSPKQKSKHSIYLEVNNLYGQAMFKFLPKSEFKWIDPKEFDLNINASSCS